MTVDLNFMGFFRKAFAHIFPRIHNYFVIYYCAWDILLPRYFGCKTFSSLMAVNG